MYGTVCWSLWLQNNNRDVNNFPYGCPYGCQSSGNYNWRYYLQLSFTADTLYALSVLCPPYPMLTCGTYGWFGPGQVAKFYVIPIVQVNQTLRYQFTGWSGAYTGTNSNGTMVMSRDEQIVANYETQYLLTTDSGNQTSSVWYNAGASVPISSPPVISTGDGARLQFVSWNEDNTTEISNDQLNVTMDSPHTVAAQFQQQYYVSVSSQVSTSTVGQGWSNAGTQAMISVATPPDPSYGTSYVFQTWQGSAALQNAGQNMTVTVNQPIHAIAIWRADSTVLYGTIVAVVAVIAVLCALVTVRRRTMTQTAAITSAAPHQEIKESTNVFCISCGKALPKGSKFCYKCGATQP